MPMSYRDILRWLQDQRFAIEETKEKAEEFSEETVKKIKFQLYLLFIRILLDVLNGFNIDKTMCGIVTSYIPYGVESREIESQLNEHSKIRMFGNNSVVYRFNVYLDIFSKNILNSMTLSFEIGFPITGSVHLKTGIYGAEFESIDSDSEEKIAKMICDIIEEEYLE